MSDRKNKQVIKLVLDVIETPRGFVPTAKSLESVVNGLNIAMSKLIELINEILTELKRLSNNVETIEKRVKTIEININLLQEQLAELKFEKNNVVQKEKVKSKESSDEKIRQELLDMLK